MFFVQPSIRHVHEQTCAYTTTSTNKHQRQLSSSALWGTCVGNWVDVCARTHGHTRTASINELGAIQFLIYCFSYCKLLPWIFGQEIGNKSLTRGNCENRIIGGSFDTRSHQDIRWYLPVKPTRKALFKRQHGSTMTRINLVRWHNCAELDLQSLSSCHVVVYQLCD